VSVNSLGLLDLVEIAAEGLAPRAQYQVYLADSDRPPFEVLQPLAVLKTNSAGAGIVQAIGPLKALSAKGAASWTTSSQRSLVITAINDPNQTVLRQTNSSNVP
jgi:hypothetical protein